MMKKFLPSLIAFTILLVGCQSAEGFLNVPASPSADLPDRPGAVSEGSSVEDSSEELSLPEIGGRDLTFTETETEGITRIQTRKGDLEVLSMMYADGCFAALSRREAGIALTGYDEAGKGIFAGILNEELEDAVLLGFAGGFVCLYSETAKNSFACTPDGVYHRMEHGKIDKVALYRHGYAFTDGNTVSLCAPDRTEPYMTYRLPDGAVWLTGDEERALIQMGGRLYLLYPDGSLSEPFSETISFSAGGLIFRAEGQTVLANPFEKTAFASAECVSVLAAGTDYLVEQLQDSVRFTLPKAGTAFTLEADNTFRFGGRTENGFLYALCGEWYLLSEEVFEPLAAHVIEYPSDENALFAAGQALCASASAAKGMVFASDGAPFALSPAVAGFTAHRITDGETLFTAAAVLISASETYGNAPNACIYLCSRVDVGDTQMDYTFFEDGGTVGVLLDVSDTEKLPGLLEEIVTILYEENRE